MATILQSLINAYIKFKIKYIFKTLPKIVMQTLRTTIIPRCLSLINKPTAHLKRWNQNFKQN